MLRATQLLPQTRYSDTEARAYVTLAAYAAHHMSLEVAGGGTLEITLSQFWSSLGPGALDVQVKFHGIVMNPGSVILLDGNRSCIPVQVRWDRPSRSRFPALALCPQQVGVEHCRRDGGGGFEMGLLGCM